MSSLKLKIFISYARNHNVKLVEMIKRDLKMRGHEVWFDKSETKAGHGRYSNPFNCQ